MDDKDHLMKHGAIMLVATVFSGIFNWGYQIAMNRMLGPKGFGILYSLLALFMIVSLPATTVQTVIAKYTSRYRAQEQWGKISYLLIRSARKLSGFLAVLLIIYLLCSRLIAGFLNIPMITPVIIIGIVLYCALLFPIGYGGLQGLERFAQLGLMYIIASFLRLISGVFLVYWLNKIMPELSVNGALLASIISIGFVLAVCYWFLRDVWRFRPYDEDIEKADIYKYFVPVAIAYFCFGVITYIDVLIVKHYFPALEAGYFSSVSMIGKAFLFLPMAFTAAMFPKVSAQYELGRDTRRLLYRTFLYSLGCCAVGIIVCTLFPRVFIYILMRRADITPEALNTMIPLLRLVGLAVTPYGLVCIIINYYLARHQIGFLFLFVPAVILQIILLALFHQTLLQVMVVLAAAGVIILISCCIPSGFIVDRIKRKH